MNQYRQKGFTLVELVLSMSFVSALLIAIALTIIQIGNSYTRGLTLKEVNQAGRSLSSELQRTISRSTSFDVSSSSVVVNQGDWGGRLCTGQYSYVWNYGKATSPDINDYVAPSTPGISFVKVEDNAGMMCQNVIIGGVSGLPNIPNDMSVELINAGTKNLAIHEFAISSVDKDSTTGQQLYSISFTIGTNESELIDISSNNCKPPSHDDSSKIDFSYCSINKFNVLIRSGNVADGGG